MKRKRDGPTGADRLILGHEDVGVLALLTPCSALPGPFLEENELQAGRDMLLADGTWTSTLLLPTAKSARSDWQRLHRFVSLSGLGWAFVLAAVLWELFALAFSKCAGWGWDKGAFFFAWGLGILALGFCLRASAKRPAFTRFFLGVNVIVLTVLSLVVATR
jgi:hypothetical protein